MSKINEQEIHVFVDAVSHYFLQTTNEKAEVKAAFLATETIRPQTFDFTGVIILSGKFRGSVYFSAPRVMLSRLLVSMHETSVSDDHLLDIVGEIANTIAGNARKHFGESMGISVPITTSSDERRQSGVSGIRARPYVIMIKWKQYQASVVIDIERVD